MDLVVTTLYLRNTGPSPPATPCPSSPLPAFPQVALMVVMAQAGCFVPAQLMSLAPMELLFTRMGTGDCIETNSSSFMLEMQVRGYGFMAG